MHLAALPWGATQQRKIYMLQRESLSCIAFCIPAMLQNLSVLVDMCRSVHRSKTSEEDKKRRLEEVDARLQKILKQNPGRKPNWSEERLQQVAAP